MNHILIIEDKKIEVPNVKLDILIKRINRSLYYNQPDAEQSIDLSDIFCKDPYQSGIINKLTELGYSNLRCYYEIGCLHLSDFDDLRVSNFLHSIFDQKYLSDKKSDRCIGECKIITDYHELILFNAQFIGEDFYPDESKLIVDYWKEIIHNPLNHES